MVSYHHPKQRIQVISDPTLDTLLFKAILTTVLENDEFTLVWRNSFETIQNNAPSRVRYSSRCLCRLLLFYTHIIRTRGFRFISVVSPKINGKYSAFCFLVWVLLLLCYSYCCYYYWCSKKSKTIFQFWFNYVLSPKNGIYKSTDEKEQRFTIPSCCKSN